MQVPDSVEHQRFEAVILPHLDSAYNLARWMTRNATDAEDIAQEAILRALRFFHGFRGENGRVWFMAIVRNTCLTRMGQRKDEQNAVEFDEYLHTGIEMMSTPESQLLRQASVEQVRRSIEQLPPHYREAIVLRELEQMSYKEIAAVTGYPIGTVMSRLTRARKKLRELVSANRTETQRRCPDA